MKYYLYQDIPGFKTPGYKEGLILEEAEFAPYECAKHPDFFIPIDEANIPAKDTTFYYVDDEYNIGAVPSMDVTEEKWEYVMGEKKGAWNLRHLASGNFFLDKAEAQKRVDQINAYVRSVFKS